MEPTTKLRKIRKDINGKTINKSNVVQRFQKYLTKKECARAEKLGKWAKTFSKYESEFTIKDINRFIEIYEIQYKVKAITKSTYTNEIKALEDLKPNKIEDIFRIDQLRTDPRKKENRNSKMKILRIDLQNVFDDRVFVNKEDLRKQLISFHSVDWSGEGDINELTLEDLCDYGDWDYKEIKKNDDNSRTKKSVSNSKKSTKLTYKDLGTTNFS
jgi:transcriptional regulator with XRE-family HTH domain